MPASQPTQQPVAPLTAIPDGADASQVRSVLARVLAGRNRLALGTSGSTGSPARAVLTGAGLTASAAATHHRLGGQGQWVLALPPGHIAGVQVMVRGELAGLPAILSAGSDGDFEPARLAQDCERAAQMNQRVYLSLVPTQLVRVLPNPLATAELARSVSAVLIGGAALPTKTKRRAVAAGLPVRTTYGSTETCGGCVYDGQPLEGVAVDLDQEGRVRLTAPWVTTGWWQPAATGDVELAGQAGVVLAQREGSGTRIESASPAPDGTPRRTLVTDDVGEIRDGRLVLHGRADDVILTGGMKVAPGVVSEAASALPGIGEVATLGITDDYWGQVIALVVTGSPRPLGEIREALRPGLPAHALPRAVRWVQDLPVRGPGKPDRQALARLAAEPDERH